MNCQKFEDVVSELAREQMMDVDLRAEALEHASDCRDCMQRLSDEERLSRGLDALKSDMQHVEAPVALESSLLAAFRSPQVAQPVFGKKSHARYWLTAVAALLLIVLGVVAMRARVDSKPQPVQAEVQKNESSKDQSVAAVPQPEQSVPQKSETVRRVVPKRKSANFVARNSARKSTRDQNVVANHVQNEVATEFMPLGYMTAANFQEGGQIVRVELPRAALANFGFPVNMDRYDEKVKADILLGADGLAHAIRFVQ